MIVTACNKTETIELSKDYDYYPLRVGSSITYEIDSFIFSDVSYPLITIDTIHYQFKEKIDTVYKDNANRDAYRIVTYRRKDISYPWETFRVWSVVRESNRIIKNEDDLHFIKLVFPIANLIAWSGNNQIVNDEENEYLQGWSYTYTQKNATYTYNGVSYDSCVQVTQLDDENAIEKKYSIEQYAKGIGLIYKEQKFLGKQRNLSNGWENPETGIWVRQVILEHE